MNQGRISIRYAKALFLLAKEKNLLDEVYNEVMEIKKIFTESLELTFALNNISIPNSKKFEIISLIFKDFNQIVIDFLKLLVKKDRQNFILSIARNYATLYRKEKKIILIKIITAKQVGSKIKENILNYFQKEYGSEIELVEIVKEDIIGGIIIRIENSEINMSVSKRLADIKHALVSEEYFK